MFPLKLLIWEPDFRQSHITISVKFEGQCAQIDAGYYVGDIPMAFPLLVF